MKIMVSLSTLAVVVIGVLGFICLQLVWIYPSGSLMVRQLAVNQSNVGSIPIQLSIFHYYVDGC